MGMRSTLLTSWQTRISAWRPTDIWTNSESWKPRPMCKNGNPDCHHERAPRGSRTGTQGLKNAYERGILPTELCKDVVKDFSGIKH